MYAIEIEGRQTNKQKEPSLLKIIFLEWYGCYEEAQYKC